jgi:hypothetical protein
MFKQDIYITIGINENTIVFWDSNPFGNSEAKVVFRMSKDLAQEFIEEYPKERNDVFVCKNGAIFDLEEGFMEDEEYIGV